MSIQNLQTDRLDINNRYNINFYCKQLDDIILKIIIYDKSLPADLSEYSYRLKAFKSDQVPLIQNSNISIDNNVLTIKASNQLTTTSGIVKAELQFINKTTLEKKSTFYLNIEVVASVLYVDSDISTATCTLLEELDYKLDQVENIGSIVDEAIVVKGQLETDITTANTSKNSLNTTITNADNKKKELETTIINAESGKEEVETIISNANTAKENLNTSVAYAEDKKLEVETTITNAEDKKQEVIEECEVADSKIKAMQEFGDVTEVAKDINKLKLDVGDITQLPTEDKSNIVNSIKEVTTHLNECVKKSNVDITYYVSATGSDNNDGLTSNTPFKTIQYAINILPQTINNNITINIVGGIYNEDITIKNFIGGGKINITGDSSVSTTRSINSITINGCKIRITITGVNITTTTKDSIAITDCSLVAIVYCNLISSSNNYSGVNVDSSLTQVAYTTISNKNIAIHGRMLSRVFSMSNSGSNNVKGLWALFGGHIYKDGTQPTGTTNEQASNGGIIS